MAKKKPPEKPQPSWLSAHPRLVIGLLVLAGLGPFVNKAVHVDDVIFVWAGQWIAQHPLDFFGSSVNIWGSMVPMWKANCNPPLMSYYLAGVGSVLGWSEIALHGGCLVIAYAAALGIYELARRWSEWPLVATVIGLITPVFWVSGTTLMCDMLMLAFWVWAVVVWERTLAETRNGWWFLAGGMLAGLAVLTKYSAVTLLPLLPLLSWVRTRRIGMWWVLGLLVPLMMIASYEWLTGRLYGHGLLGVATRFAQTHRVGFSGGWLAKAVIGLTFTGGSLLPMLFLAPRLWRWRTGLVLGILALGLPTGLFRMFGNLGLAVPWKNSSLVEHWDFQVQVIILTAVGLLLVLLVMAEAWEQRNGTTMFLVCWILSGLVFAWVLNWTVSVRNFLPLVPAVVILVVRRLGRLGKVVRPGWLWWSLVPAAVFTLNVAVADCRLANWGRTGAQKIAANFKPADHQLWFEGGYGTFQYYMERLGGRRINTENSELLAGDVVAMSWFNDNVFPLPAGKVGWLGYWELPPFWWINVIGSNQRSAAGFYGADSGPVPFVIGHLPNQLYYVVKVLSWIQFQTQATNPQEIEAGGVPNFPRIFYRGPKYTPPSVNPEATEHLQLAEQLEHEGKDAEAIQQCRQALAASPDNPVVMNNLAWLLAKSSHAELRDGNEAVQLASKALDLTDCREPSMMGMLATAYAEAGQFDKAIETTKAALGLARVTEQKGLVDKFEQIQSQYASGKKPNLETAQ